MNVVSPHISVLLQEAVEGLKPKDGGVYVDGTFGAGGHTKALLEAANCNIVAIDRDPHVARFVKELEGKYGSRITFIAGQFGDMVSLLRGEGIEQVDGILLDIGVSSLQIDSAERGFSFQQDGPLDMRMGNQGETAADIINRAEEEELAGIIFKYGDERKSRKIARAIVAARVQQPITTTLQLADIVRQAVRSYNDTIHPATRTFQALRIWVNDELGELERALEGAEELLVPEGRLAVITFHSGEDSIVKRFMQERSGKTEGISRYQPMPANDGKQPTFELVGKKVIKPQPSELKDNIRARSAKLRIAARTHASVWHSHEEL